MTASSDYFETSGGVLEAQDTERVVCFESASIDISSFTSVDVSVDVVENGDHEAADFVDVILVVDGVENLITNFNGLGSATHTLVGDIPDDGDFGSATVTGAATGSSLVVKICLINNAGSEQITLDNIVVEGSTAPITPTVAINEIHYNPAEPFTDTTEFVEIINYGANPVDLSGYTFPSGLGFTFPGGTSLAPGEYFVLAVNATAFNNFYGCAPDGDFSGALSNSGELLELADASGNIINAVDYDDNAAWGSDADGDGPSLELLDPTADNSDPANWDVSAVDGGTPGAMNGGFLNRCTPINVVINEIHYNSNDGAGFPDSEWEFVELYNPGPTSIDLSGWAVSDGEGSNTFPSGTTIGVDEYIVVAEDASTFSGASYQVFEWAGNFALSNSGDNVDLLDAGGNLFDQVNYDDSSPWPTAADGDGPSLELNDWQLDNDNGANWSATGPDNGTPGAQNSQVTGAGCTLELSLNEVDCESVGPGTTDDTYYAFVDFVGGGDDVYTIVPNSGTLSALSDDPDTDADGGLLLIEGIAEGTDLELTVTSTGGCDFSFSVKSPVCIPASPVVINEIHYNGLESNTDTTEFVELYNTGAAPVDLSGYTFSAGITFTFPSGAMIGAGEYVVVAVNAVAFENFYGCTPDYDFSGGLSNSGELVRLENGAGGLIDEVSYDDGGGWPTAADGSGPSIELLDPMSDNTDPANWAASLIDGGTPGAMNQGTGTGCIVIPNVALDYKNSENGESAITNRTIKPQLRIKNLDTQTLDLADFTARYYFTSDAVGPMTLTCLSSDAGCGNTLTSLMAINPAVAGADRYFEVGFSSGTIAPGQRVNTKTKIGNTANLSFDEADDFSFVGIITDHVFNPYVTLYYKGILIQGTEPDLGAGLRSIEPVELAEVAPLQVEAFPNPFANSFVVEFFEMPEAAYDLQLVNSVGQIVYTATSDAPSVKVSVENLPAGMYILRLRQGEVVSTTKLMKE
ncbi:MAG: lamin tail domain-containing protein [Bacteroidota bacterium]